MQLVGCSPQASAYNPTACVEHPRVPEPGCCCHEDRKATGEPSCSIALPPELNVSQRGFLVFICLSVFLSHCRFHLDVFLWKSCKTKRCTLFFSNSLYLHLQFIHRQSQGKRHCLQMHHKIVKTERLQWQALQTEETVSCNTLFSLLSTEDHCNSASYISPFSVFEFLKLSSLRKWLWFHLCTLLSLSGMCAPRGVQEFRLHRSLLRGAAVISISQTTVRLHISISMLRQNYILKYMILDRHHFFMLLVYVCLNCVYLVSIK